MSSFSYDWIRNVLDLVVIRKPIESRHMSLPFETLSLLFLVIFYLVCIWRNRIRTISERRCQKIAEGRFDFFSLFCCKGSFFDKRHPAIIKPDLTDWTQWEICADNVNFIGYVFWRSACREFDLNITVVIFKHNLPPSSLSAPWLDRDPFFISRDFAFDGEAINIVIEFLPRPCHLFIPQNLV